MQQWLLFSYAVFYELLRQLLLDEVWWNSYHCTCTIVWAVRHHLLMEAWFQGRLW